MLLLLCAFLHLAIAGPMSFEATLTVDELPSGKSLQGVWLRQDGSEPMIIDYRPHGCWTPFAQRRVRVTGSTYAPSGQAITATHFRVETLEVVDPAHMTSLLSVGPEQTLEGTLRTATGLAGSKQEGTTWPVLVTTNETWRILNTADVARFSEGQSLTIDARQVVLSPFTAHAAEPRVYVIRARAR